MAHALSWKIDTQRTAKASSMKRHDLTISVPMEKGKSSVGKMENKCCRCKKMPCDWLKHQAYDVMVLGCPLFEDMGEGMIGCGKQRELQSFYGEQEKRWPEGMHSIRQELDIVRICDLMQDPECPAWKWFPNNAEIKNLAEYLVSKGLTFKEE